MLCHTHYTIRVATKEIATNCDVQSDTWVALSAARHKEGLVAALAEWGCASCYMYVLMAAEPGWRFLERASWGGVPSGSA